MTHPRYFPVRCLLCGRWFGEYAPRPYGVPLHKLMNHFTQKHGRVLP